MKCRGEGAPRGAGAASFEMFSYLILCPSKGPSLICPAWPPLPPLPCSTASLVQLMIPGAACHLDFTTTSFSSFLDAPASEA